MQRLKFISAFDVLSTMRSNCSEVVLCYFSWNPVKEDINIGMPDTAGKLDILHAAVALDIELFITTISAGCKLNIYSQQKCQNYNS